MQPTDKYEFRVKRQNNEGRECWARLSDYKRNNPYPVVWVFYREEATLFTKGEAFAIIRRYPMTALMEREEMNAAA
jgi:hypothetical protein